MSETFDAYRKSYGSAVEQSVAFTGLAHEFFLRAKIELMDEMLKTRQFDPSDKHLVDVGCGVGSMHDLLMPMFGRITGVDTSSESIAEARDRHPANVYESYDGQRLPLSDRSVDFALTVCVIHHVPVVQWQSFVDEMRRVVRPGGFICIIEHNPLNPLTRLGVARCAFDADAVLLGKARTEALMRQSGIVDVETRYFLLSPFAVRPLQAIERAFARLPLGGQYLTLGMVR
ncbi:MAG: hypothetical protein BGP04_14460 [Rhizobiales bacterium 62-17]|nr:class I SAM-dependent methyltransferase [Hyphomicrobiales bacterium]OJY03006.1 MAG: hypothetical protein BGP04_14460 [Rhizobiales bacterium 62-17]